MMTFLAVMGGITFAGELAVMITMFASKRVRKWTRNQIKIIAKECVEFLDELDKEL